MKNNAKHMHKTHGATVIKMMMFIKSANCSTQLEGKSFELIGKRGDLKNGRNIITNLSARATRSLPCNMRTQEVRRLCSWI